ncbi:hypothetical protein N0V94_001428 [Neodidymelliopsis sp. IMI 364377]|nr:hypothetical protein N0V94_001428 [Neodidymelliopsis sp. IMI 364377]
MVNWQDKGTADRLLAAVIASHGNKVNCREVARLFGDGATYDAIENYLRKPKKQALALKAAAEDREAPATPTTTRKKTTATTPTSTAFQVEGDMLIVGPAVKGSRVTKSKKEAKETKAKLRAELRKEDLMLLGTPATGTMSDEEAEVI